MVVPKMKKAGDESPAVEAHFSTELTIHLLSASVNQNFHTGQGGPLLSSRPPPPVISSGASRLFSSASLLRSGRLAQREISLPLSPLRRLRRDRAHALVRHQRRHSVSAGRRSLILGGCLAALQSLHHGPRIEPPSPNGRSTLIAPSSDFPAQSTAINERK